MVCPHQWIHDSVPITNKVIDVYVCHKKMPKIYCWVEKLVVESIYGMIHFILNRHLCMHTHKNTRTHEHKHMLV